MREKEHALETNGIEIAKKLRKEHPEHIEIPILIYSQYFNTGKKYKDEDIGIFAFSKRGNPDPAFLPSFIANIFLRWRPSKDDFAGTAPQ